MLGLSERRIALRTNAARSKAKFNAAQAMIEKLLQAEKETGIDVSTEMAAQHRLKVEALVEYNAIEREFIDKYPAHIDEILAHRPHKPEPAGRSRRGRRYATST